MTNLNRDTLGKILEFLPRKTAVELAAQTGKSSLFTEALRSNRKKIDNIQLAQTLLEAIDRGEEDQVKKILDTLKSSHPQRLAWLLSYKAAFTDHAERTFQGITALQMAAWNQDTPMRDLIRGYMNDKDVAEQINALAIHGIGYAMRISDVIRLKTIAPELPIPFQSDTESLSYFKCKSEEEDENTYILLNEKHYGWAFHALQSALQACIDTVMLRHQAGDYRWHLIQRLWLNIGFTQYYLTAPYVNAYCCKTRFYPSPNFHRITPARMSTLDNTLGDKSDHFFDSLNYQDLGFSFALFKGTRERPETMHNAPPPVPAWEREALSRLRRQDCTFDLAAVSHLYEVRTANWQALKEEVQSALSLPAVRF